jgi:hypothetical protein
MSKSECAKRHYQKHKEYIKEKSKKYYMDNKEIILEKMKTKSRSQRGDRAYQEYRRNIELRYLFGITLDDYNKLKENQNYKCAICGNERSEKKDFHVDHCHSTGKIRGLLCSNCNTGLGQFKDNIELLNKAISYLKET